MSLINNLVSAIKNNHIGNGAVVGIDIGSSSMKVVELRDNKGVITLSTYGEIQLGPYSSRAVGDSVQLDSKQEQQALVDLIRESAVGARSAVFAMPLSSSFVTNVSINANEEVDLAAMVRIEARKVIPASLSEVTLDWEEVTALKNRKQDHTGSDSKLARDILIAAIQNSALERYKILMQFAGLGQPPTEIECFSVLRGLYDTDESEAAIMDLGAASAKLYIMRDGQLVRMYRIRAGGALATRKIAEALEINFDEAEEIKCALTKEDERFVTVRNAHHASYERAFREFSQVLKDYELRRGGNIKTVYLSGGGSLFPGVDSYLKEVLRREVQYGNPFSKVAYPAFMEDVMKEIGPSFAVSLGAAMRAFE